MIARLKNLIARSDGSTIMEFAIIAPVMLTMLVGLFDLSRTSYARSVLQGAIQKAARDGTLQTPNLSTLDTRVQNQVRPIVGTAATFTSSWRSYSSFSDVGQPEALTDTNGNHQRDLGECFVDENANGTWDADVGVTGSGGASDVVLYTVTVSYPRILPMDKLLRWSPNQTVSASTVLRNQPWQDQSVIATVTICTP
jgi:Flp pilus assembly protein TadG